MRADYLENIVGDLEAAHAAHKAAVSLDPTSTDALGGYAGFLFYTLGDAESALTYYRRESRHKNPVDGCTFPCDVFLLLGVQALKGARGRTRGVHAP